MRGPMPYLVLDKAMDAVAFYERAFGAEVVGEPAVDDKGQVMNVMVRINDGILMMNDYMPEMGPKPSMSGPACTMQLVVDDGQAWWDRAVAAGCEVSMPFAKQFWGDTYGRLTDPFGWDWAILEPSAESRAKSAEIAAAK